jgi:ribosome recycling factor
MVKPIEKAILSSDLGLNPNTAGQVIRIPLPPLTEERRKELGKVVHNEGEHAKIAIRNIRRDANHQIKELLKEKAISEDDERRAETDIQGVTDLAVSKVDEIVAEKEQELLEI